MAGEWAERPLGELTQNFDALRVPVKQADRRPGPYPYYGASGVVDYVDRFIFDGEYLLVAEDGENLRTRTIPVAFLARGKFWVNNHAHIVRGNGEADTRFLMYALSQTDISGYLTGSTMPKLTQGNMNRIPILAPSLPEQRAIAHILGTLDDKIELNRRMSETLEGMARALFQSWFVSFDPVRAKMEGRWRSGKSLPGLPAELYNLFPDRLVGSELGEIPEGWEVMPIGKVVQCVGGSTPRTKEPKYWDGGGICWATPKDLSGQEHAVLLDTDRKITEAGLSKISSGLLPVGTVLMSSRAPVGYLAIAAVPTAVNQGFIAMRCEGRIDEHYLLHWACQEMDQITSRAGGTTFAEISKRSFRPIPILVPDKAAHDAWHRIAVALHSKVVQNLREARTLATLRDTLLPKLISGELRVKDVNRLVGRRPTKSREVQA